MTSAIDAYMEKRKARKEELLAQKQGLMKKLNDTERTIQALAAQKDKMFLDMAALTGRISEVDDEIKDVQGPVAEGEPT
jgi:phage shock protein A